jgi:ABC-type transporter lipoprotein component MlaA
MSNIITVYPYADSGGDGSVVLLYFSSKEKRDAYREAHEDSDSFEGFTDNDHQFQIEVLDDGSWKFVSNSYNAWEFDPVYGE